MFGEEAIAQQLADARAALDNAVKSGGDHKIEPVTVESADGRLRVTVGIEGRVDELFVDPRALREGSEAVAAELQRLVNEALDKHAQSLATDEPMPDLAAISESVAEMQDRSLRQLQEMTASISQTLSKLNRRA